MSGDPAVAWIDVTRALRSGHPNWPGDEPFAWDLNARIAEGAAVNAGAIRTSLHVGTHVDAPWHYDDAGVRLGGVSLARYMGEAWLLDVSTGDGAVGVDALRSAAGGAPLPPRVLLRTGQPDDWGTHFPTDFRAVSPEAVAWLAERGVRLLATDAPSVDPLTSKDLPAHRACAAHDVLIAEGLALARAPTGRCELLLLPLSLPDADASPARALLRPWRAD